MKELSDILMDQINKLEAKNSELKTENAELKAMIAELKAMIGELQDMNVKLKAAAGAGSGSDTNRPNTGRGGGRGVGRGGGGGNGSDHKKQQQTKGTLTSFPIYLENCKSLKAYQEALSDLVISPECPGENVDVFVNKIKNGTLNRAYRVIFRLENWQNLYEFNCYISTKEVCGIRLSIRTTCCPYG